MLLEQDLPKDIGYPVKVTFGDLGTVDAFLKNNVLRGNRIPGKYD